MSQAAKKLITHPEAQPQWNRRILVVDDEIEILKSYQEILTPQRLAPRVKSSRSADVIPIKGGEPVVFDVVTVATVDQALAEVKKSQQNHQPFAMGFFDVRLGEQRDGVELVREIRLLDPQIWAVFVTAYNDRSLSSIASELGDDNAHWDYLNKPFNPNEITQKAQIFTSLWNLRKERESQALALSELNRRVLESERITSVAAVARGVAHEFGNLLMQIIGRAEVSRNKSPAEMGQALDRIIEASQRASDILDRFNHLSDHGSAKFVKKAESLHHIVEEALDLLGHRFKKESVAVDYKSEGDSTAEVHGTSLLQVLVNLLINATHALEGRENKRIEIRLGSKGDHVTVVVRDNGPGAPAEHLDKLTEAFFTTKGKKGTGLGLAICREIVEIDHRGEFQLSNHPDGGFQALMMIPKKGDEDV